MEKDLRDSIALYVSRIGYEEASNIAFSKLVDNTNLCIAPDGPMMDLPDYLIGRIKFHIAVIEYLYCNEDEVDGFCMAETKI